MNKTEFNELKKILLSHCNDMGILRDDAQDKKKKAILDSLVISIINDVLSTQEVKNCIKGVKKDKVVNIDFFKQEVENCVRDVEKDKVVNIDFFKQEVENCIRDVKKDKVVNIDFFKNGGNLFEHYINPRWVSFAKELFTQRSIGLGTPNAASGEGELMFLFLSKNIKKPPKGDLEVAGEIIELKGEKGVRVMGEIRGSDFREKTLEVCKEFKLTPNKSHRTNLDAVEIEKIKHFAYWERELSKIPLQKQKEFIAKWLSCIDGKNHNESVVKIFKQDSFNHDIFIKEIIKILYAVMVRSGNFSKFIILGDGTNSKIISDVKDFNKKVDRGEIVPCSDFFRINQRYNIGWYIS